MVFPFPDDITVRIHFTHSAFTFVRDKDVTVCQLMNVAYLKMISRLVRLQWCDMYYLALWVHFHRLRRSLLRDERVWTAWRMCDDRGEGRL